MTLATVSPREWEQLGGFLLRVADAWWSSVRAVLLSTARWTHLPMPGDLRGVSGFPDDDVIEVVERVFGCSRDQVLAMTMHRFPLGLFGRPGLAGTAGTDPTAPSLIDGGVYCASCVADNHWDLRWRTGLTAVCVTHREYVRSRCPECGRVVSPEAVRADVSRARGVLVHGRRAGEGCAVELVAHPAAVSETHFAAQVRLDELMAAASDGGTGAAATTRDVLRWAEWLHRGRGDATALLTGGMANADGPDLAELLAVGLRLAGLTPARAARHPEVEIAVLRQATASTRPAAPPRYTAFGAGVDTVLEAHRTATRSPIRLPASPAWLRGEHGHGLPQVVPLSEFRAALRCHVDFLTRDRGRVLTAICAAMPPGVAAWRQCAVTLHLPVDLGHRAGALAALIDRLGRSDAFWSALCEYRARMAERNIDFDRRVARVLQDDLVVDAARLTWPPLAREDSNAVRQWLLERWACQYLATLPAGLAGRRTAMRDSRPRIDGLVAGTTAVDLVWDRWSPEGWTHAAR